MIPNSVQSVIRDWVEVCNSNAYKETYTEDKVIDGKPVTYEYIFPQERVSPNEITNAICIDCPHAIWKCYKTEQECGNNPPPCKGTIHTYKTQNNITMGGTIAKKEFAYLACFCAKEHAYVQNFPFNCSGNDWELQEEMEQLADQVILSSRQAEEQERGHSRKM